MPKSTLIIGAGLGGLVAANQLHRAGRPCHILEASDGVGGRVRSDVVDGFILDRGFQVLLDGYPSVPKFLDLAALQPQIFDAGALLYDRGDFFRLLHPIRHPDWFGSSGLSPAFSWADKLALASLVASCAAHPDAALLSRFTPDSETTLALLQRLGISDTMIQRFIRPFFGGVFLDDSLLTSAALFRYYLKKFALGQVLIPARGMGAIPDQLAARLPQNCVRLHTRVTRLEVAGTRVTAAITDSGERVEADQFILATDERSTRELLGRPASVPRPSLGVTTVYLKSRQSLYTGGLLVLPASDTNRLTTHLVQLTNIAPGLAPAPWHLIGVTVLHPGERSDREVAAQVQREVGDIFTEASGHLEFLHMVRTPYAQFSQHPEFAPSPIAMPLPENVHLAGDQTGTCSIESAMSSGARAAAQLLATP